MYKMATIRNKSQFTKFVSRRKIMAPVWVLLAVLVFQSATVFSSDDDYQKKFNKLMDSCKKETNSLKKNLEETVDDCLDLTDLSKITKMEDKIDDLQDKIDTVKDTLKDIQSLAQEKVKSESKSLVNTGKSLISSVFSFF